MFFLQNQVNIWFSVLSKLVKIYENMVFSVNDTNNDEL